VHLRAHPARVRYEDPAPVSLPSFFSHARSRRRAVRVSRASPLSPEGLPFESLQRTVLQARRVDVCSPPSFVFQRRAPASRWRPVSSWACAHFSPVESLGSRRATPREACRLLEHESIVLSRTRSPTEPLDVPSRPWSLSLPASLPETSSPFSSRARELTRCPEPGRLQPMRLLSECLCAGSRPPDDHCASR
jgi:hypothetical protein